MSFISQILPSTRSCSFLSTQLLRIQDKPLSIKVAVAVVGIFACFALAYVLYIGISALRNRISSQRVQTPAPRFTIDYENRGTSITLPREQCQAAIQCPDAAWVQLQAGGSTGSYVLNVLPSLPQTESVNYQQVLANGVVIVAQAMSVEEVRQEIQDRAWVSIEEFARLTGLQRG